MTTAGGSADGGRGAFERVGKQILANGFHYADAADERAGEHILGLLNAGAWHPVETAPLDGTVVLLTGGRFYCEKREEYISGPFTAAWCDDYWLIGGAESGYVCIGYDGATHWMPLPSAPVAP